MLVETRNGTINVSDILESMSEVVKNHVEFKKKYSHTDVFKMDYYAEDVYLLTDYLNKRILLDDITPAKYNLLCNMADFLLIDFQYNILREYVVDTILDKICKYRGTKFDLLSRLGKLKFGYMSNSVSQSFTSIGMRELILCNDIHLIKDTFARPVYVDEGVMYETLVPKSKNTIIIETKWLPSHGHSVDREEARVSIVNFWNTSTDNKKVIVDVYMNYIKRKQNEKN